MPSTKVIKTKPVEATRKPVDRTTPATTEAASGANGAVRKSRASSCPRCPQQRGRCAGRGAPGTSCEGRARARSVSRWPRAQPDYRRATGSSKHDNPQWRRGTSGCPAGERGPRGPGGPRGPRSVRAESQCAIQR
ncbi:Hypothetical protein SMAX5B_009692 [Scophthalmus maximus]|uniref:Uncharacterized protein n=1 Tax=Scophthalmus maximus TaxID=52904 RepID=A0A2U9CY71_SCOMX|nr:Hypothetical protein SMAX5B_009692 [Scophthalmus maximus]